MTWLDKLNEMRRISGMSLDELSRASSVPKGTLAKITSGATRDPKLETVLQLVTAMGFTLGDLTPNAAPGPSALSPEAAALARDYDRLDIWGRRQLRAVADNELRRSKAGTSADGDVPVRTKIIPLLGNSFAAGIGEPDFGNALEEYELPADVRADFAVRVNGDSMEPWLPDGSVALGVKGTPGDGDVAALMVDGAFYIKQICIDAIGNLYLFSLNRARKDADLTVWASAGSNVSCFGTILMKNRVPLPLD